MPNNKNILVIGSILILIGVLVLIGQISGWIWDWEVIWPLIPILIGLIMLVGANTDKGVTFPATILIGVGALFFIQNSHILPPNIGMTELWPFFPIIVGLAFFILWLTNPRDNGVLIPSAACLITGIVFLSINLSGWVVYTAPALIILVGLIIIINSMRFKLNPSDKKESNAKASVESKNEQAVEGEGRIQ